MIRTYIITFASGREIRRDGLSSAQVQRAVAKWATEGFTIRVEV
jgi:hypothetical protein